MQLGEESKVKWLPIPFFFAYGLVMVFLSEVVAQALPDMLNDTSSLSEMEGKLNIAERSSFTTEEAALAIGGAAKLIVKIILPCQTTQIPYLFRIILLFAFYVAGLAIVLVSHSPLARLVGVVAFESGSAMAEVTFLSLTAFYGEYAVKSFVAGGGLSLVAGPLYYAGVLEWTCVSPRLAVVFIAPLLPCFFLLYVFMNRSLSACKSQNTAFPSVRYASIRNPSKEQDIQELNLSKKFTIVWRLFMTMTYMFLLYFADELSMKAFVKPLAYPHKDLYPMGRSTYYTFANAIGKFLGRVYLLLVSITCSFLVPYLQIKSTWILATVGSILSFVLVFGSWFRFKTEVEFVVAYSVVMGFLTGNIYANSALLVHQETTAVSRRELALGILTLGSSAGLYAARLMELYLRPHLTKHCLFELQLGRNCFSVNSYFVDWQNNMPCY